MRSSYSLTKWMYNYSNEYENIKAELDAGADVNSIREGCKYPVLFLTRDPNVAKLLINRGANVNYRVDNISPLIYFAENGRIEIVRLILESQRFESSDKEIAVKRAKKEGHTEVARIIYNYGIPESEHIRPLSLFEKNQVE